MLYPAPWLGVTSNKRHTQLFHKAGLIQLNPCFGLFISKKPTFFQFVKEQPFQRTEDGGQKTDKSVYFLRLRPLRVNRSFKRFVLNSQRMEDRRRRTDILSRLSRTLFLSSVFCPLSSELVEDDGIEPTTPCLQTRCSPS